MRKASLLFVTLAAFLAVHAVASAQTNPEFGLKVHVQLDAAEQIQPRPVIFGYDPRAQDGLEGGLSNPAWFDSEVGASEEPWIQDDFGGPDLLIADFGGHYGDFTKIDIRHKPDSISYETTYYIFVNTGDKSKTAIISWDPAQIPAIVKHINIRQLNVSSRPEVDMKTTNAYAVQYADGSTTRKEYLELKLYYNREPLNAVEGPLEASQLLVFPNPAGDFVNVAAAGRNLENAPYELVDVTGRQIAEGLLTLNGAGSYGISRPTNFSGVAFLRLRIGGAVQTIPVIFDR